MKISLTFGYLLCLCCRTIQSGMVQLSLRDKNGGLAPGGFRLHYTDVDLAPPSKRERAVVLAGRDKGKVGTVNVSLGSPCVVVRLLDACLCGELLDIARQPAVHMQTSPFIDCVLLNSNSARRPCSATTW
jgi:hypothetical protein